MNALIHLFSALPLWMRASILLMFPLAIWLLLGKSLLRVLSVIPFLIRKVFHCGYLMLELPVSALHRKFGLFFCEMENRMSFVGAKIDLGLNRWHRAWRFPVKRYAGIAAIIYSLCVVLVALPGSLHIKSDWLNIGEQVFIRNESVLIQWLQEHEWYNPLQLPFWEEEMESIVGNDRPVTMLVSVGEGTLAVRDVPSTENCMILESLSDGSSVIWYGDLAFGSVGNGNIEPWIKVTTSSGTEGWIRLRFVHPEKNANLKIHCWQQYLKLHD